MKSHIKRFIQHVPIEGVQPTQLDQILQLLTDNLLEQFDTWRKGKKIINILGPTAEISQLHDIDMRQRAVVRMQVLHEERT